MENRFTLPTTPITQGCMALLCRGKRMGRTVLVEDYDPEANLWSVIIPGPVHRGSHRGKVPPHFLLAIEGYVTGRPSRDNIVIKNYKQQK